MEKKAIAWKTKGMNQDLSASAFNSEFSFENMNIRLSTNEGNTIMSWVNERGTEAVTLSQSIAGIPIGTAVIDHKLVVFTTENTQEEHPAEKTDRIYRLSFSNADKTSIQVSLLFYGNLNLSTLCPLETLVSYETSDIQKVYWTDGRNQPRVINIANETRLMKWDAAATHEIAPFFDFVPAVNQSGTLVNIAKNVTSGTFAPGVIQYLFTYYNRNGQQSCVFYTSPLYYLSHDDRGASPEDSVTCSFSITIENADTLFDYIRVYSLQRTSLNSTPVARLVTDLGIPVNGTVTTIDDGTIGTAIDPTELLFLGGKEVSVLTMEEKDSTLFLGNVTETGITHTNIQKYFRENTPEIQFRESKELAQESLKYTYYRHTPTLGKNKREITTFKGGELYRLGFQLQSATGEWSEPIFLDDVRNDVYPQVDSEHKRIAHLAEAHCTLSFNAFIDDDSGAYYIENFLSKYRKVRPVVVYPDIHNRSVVCQGVVNPTVFNVEDRVNNAPFAQSSWFFRPYDLLNNNTNSKGKSLEFRHYASIRSMTDTSERIVDGGSGDTWATEDEVRQVEIQGAWNTYAGVTSSQKSTVEVPSTNSAGHETLEVNSNMQFFIDQSIVTVNSPDLEFDTQAQKLSTEDWKFRVIGYIPITGYISSHHISASSTSVGMYAGRTCVGTGEDSMNVKTYNRSPYAVRRLVALDLWGDNAVNNSETPKTILELASDKKFYVYPWQRKGPINNDTDGNGDYSNLNTKKIAHLLVSGESYYLAGTSTVGFEDISVAVHLQENAEVLNYRLKPQIDGYEYPNYYPNVDKVLYTNIPYRLIAHVDEENRDAYINSRRKSFAQYATHPIAMKYLSGTHAVVALGKERTFNAKIPIMPYAVVDGTDYGKSNYTGNSHKYWQEDGYNFANPQQGIELIDMENDTKYSFLWLGEFYRDIVLPFGGKTDAAIRQNKWLVGGDAVDITAENIGNIPLVWSEGDTYYQRYDCLKTYPFTNDDPNQIIEILSFMCETHVNLDGRYDKNRGLLDNTNVSPQNFNLMNPVYSQQDNFFTYQKTDEDTASHTEYPNLVTYSKTKTAGADVDLWTNITLASTLDLDGNKGRLNKLAKLNNTLLAFQDTGIAQILYNENTQLSTTEGVPVEIANSGKVQGARYLSDSVGCSNKWAMTEGQAGIYFADSMTRSIYLFNGQLEDLAQKYGMNSWCKNHLPDYSKVWTPDNMANMVAYYDKQNKEALFICGGKALAYSEKIGSFTSFYDYYAPYFCNFDDTGIWLTTDGQSTDVWKHQAGEYCNFFNESKPYWMTLLGNAEPLRDKIFTNLEFRANVDGDGTMQGSTFTPHLPFDSLEVWDEYQHGIVQFDKSRGTGKYAALHHTSDGLGSLRRKFRMWRCDIPRDNAEVTPETESAMGIKRFVKHPMDRIRNPWVYLKLQKDAATDGAMPKTEIHDLLATYFV